MQVSLYDSISKENRYIRSGTKSGVSGKGGYGRTQTQDLDSDIDTGTNTDTDTNGNGLDIEAYQNLKVHRAITYCAPFIPRLNVAMEFFFKPKFFKQVRSPLL